jgi:hypothetical protein
MYGFASPRSAWAFTALNLALTVARFAAVAHRAGGAVMSTKTVKLDLTIGETRSLLEAFIKTSLCSCPSNCGINLVDKLQTAIAEAAKPTSTHSVVPALDAWLEHAKMNGCLARGLLVRNPHAELVRLLPSVQDYFARTFASYDKRRNAFEFRNGAVLQLAVCETAAQAERFSGAELTFVDTGLLLGWDTHVLTFIKSRMRCAYPSVKLEWFSDKSREVQS